MFLAKDYKRDQKQKENDQNQQKKNTFCFKATEWMNDKLRFNKEFHQIK